MNRPYGANHDSSLSALVSEVKRVDREAKRLPVLRWATVYSTNPLRVQLDGDPLPLLGKPSTLIHPSQLAAGDRVQISIQMEKVTIQGKGGGLALPDPQTAAVSAAASVTASAGSWQNVPGMPQIFVNDLPQPLIARVSFLSQARASSGYSMIGVLIQGATSVLEQQSDVGTSDSMVSGNAPFAATTTDTHIYGQKIVTFQPGTSWIRMRSRRSAGGTHSTNYPAMFFEPIKWTG